MSDDPNISAVAPAGSPTAGGVMPVAPPASWNALVLSVAWITFSDLHLKLPVVVAVLAWAYGALHPDAKDACDDFANHVLWLGGGIAVGTVLKKGKS